MTTEKYYQHDVDCHELNGRIEAIQNDGKSTRIIMDRTVFFPTGGGQPCDTGTIVTPDGTSVSVVDVQEDKESGIISHTIEIDPSETDALQVGMTVTQKLNEDRRRVNTQRHTGEHILTGAFIQLFGGANKGFHMGGEYVTIDMDYDGKKLTEEQVRAAEKLANEVIWANLPVTVSTFPNREEASVMPTRKPVTQDGEITIVTIGDLESPHDCVACCGTHFHRTGEVGLIRIHKFEPNKGMNRIYFECGDRALESMQSDDTLLRSVQERFSAGSHDLLQKMDIRDEKEAELRQDCTGLRQYYRDREMARITSLLHRDTPDFYQDSFTLVSPDDLLKLGFAIMEDEAAPALMALVHRPSHTVLLFSDGSRNCGALVKEHAKSLGGRGGGRPDQARALMPNEDAVEKFIESLKE
ncbi:MAG: alanine--tRNA ligase-related protein [Clostridia bacterium]|uniref:alanyl-tRNA editing protein n=1 Tax=Mogibacterium TaxID=86331 RepID=UPI002409B254|nr:MULTISPECIES: alanine--tRNA ligase-related protein [Mogibacterium]MCI7123684.1 alanine--tRNA ligase-related protein [Mogibacterium sp.]MDD6700043.1 alanine--tRNA ligase-related protein [Mogibacterium kristiansenii]MDY5450755.1 alanine--tRNA ligase-related protein [Clostridia bacterium]